MARAGRSPDGTRSRACAILGKSGIVLKSSNLARIPPLDSISREGDDGIVLSSIAIGRFEL